MDRLKRHDGLSFLVLFAHSEASEVVLCRAIGVALGSSIQVILF